MLSQWHGAVPMSAGPAISASFLLLLSGRTGAASGIDDLVERPAAHRHKADVPADERSGMTVDADDDRKLLRKLIAQGGSKYTAGNIDRRKYERLVELGWLTATSPNIGDVLYEVTDKGRQGAG